ETSIGDGNEGDISSYFYNFDNNVNAEFYLFDNTNFYLSYKEYLNLYGQPPPILTLRNFPDYLAEISPSDVQYTERTKIDTLLEEIVLLDSIEILSENFTNIDVLNWNHNDPTVQNVGDQRYETLTSNGNTQSANILYSDTLQTRFYRAVVDTPIILSGIMFVDQSEWIDTTYVYSSSTIPFTQSFQYEKTQLNSELLIYRLNTDCNENRQWDAAGFVDTGNSIWDPAEAFLDHNGTPGYQIDEPFQDRNCNGDRDEAEEYTDSNTNGNYDLGEPFFEDTVLVEINERFTDVNGDGIAQPDELFVITQKPNNLLVSWEDLNNPRILAHIEPGDSLVDRWGTTHQNIIEFATINDVQNRTVDNLDSLVTLFTNQVIEHLPTHNGGDYFITKTEWTNYGGERFYDYLLFKEDNHVFKLTHPTYFTPDGFTSDFWSSNEIVDEVMFYTVNGRLRDGEVIEEEYFDSTSVAIYKIEKSFIVESDTITMPAKKVRAYDDNGTLVCYGDTELAVDDPSDCPAADTTFFDCFKITRTLTMTLIGNGVEFGSRDVTWLAKDMGIVRDEMYIRWTEPSGPFAVDGEIWYGISKWELGTFISSSSSAMGKLLAKKHYRKLDEFELLPDFENDPYRINHVYGFQRVIIPEE
ncbi:MAG: hypothetical protein HQ509_02210, partial [Candidatus Marinimicrobia bacterium]|nr:hypothetical protein [Candidatus Neomarinimicrobiota bacterium]